MRTVKVLLTVLAILSLAGCKKKVEVSEAELDKTTIKLLNAGAEPKKQLRYKFQANRKDVLAMELKMSMDAGIPGVPIGEMDIPLIKMVAEVVSKNINEKGNLTYSMTVTSVDVEGAGKERPFAAIPATGEINPDDLLKELQDIVGTGATEVVTPQGFAEAAPGDKASSISNQLQKISGNSMMQPEENLWVPLPDEPVGRGAKWTAARTMRENGILFTQLMTYELVELTGDRGKVKLTVKQEAPEQEFTSPDMPPGAQAEIEKLDSRGTGSVSFDLNRPVTSMDLDMNIAMQIMVKAQGQKVRAKPKVRMQVWFKPQAAAAEVQPEG